MYILPNILKIASNITANVVGVVPIFRPLAAGIKAVGNTGSSWIKTGLKWASVAMVTSAVLGIVATAAAPGLGITTAASLSGLGQSLFATGVQATLTSSSQFGLGTLELALDTVGKLSGHIPFIGGALQNIGNFMGGLLEHIPFIKNLHLPWGEAFTPNHPIESKPFGQGFGSGWNGTWQTITTGFGATFDVLGKMITR